MRFVIFKDKVGEWRFRIVATNGQIVAQSEGYKNRVDAFNTVMSIRAKSADAAVVSGVDEVTDASTNS